jgi:cytochrome c oxidase cbb3-type subunit 1/cytochrome c oxidase cbb3-type subunit I/II
LSTAEESIPHGYQTVKAFALTSAAWFAIATTFGLTAATYLIAPDFLANIEYIHFGRMRPMHINAVLFGFVTPGLIAAAFYYLPRLMKTRLYSEKLGVLSAVFWNLTVAAGMVGISLGHSQGRE